MLPFHKRARANSIMEIGSEELEAVELPAVRPPSVRPGAFASVRPSSAPMFPQTSSRRYNDYDAEEMTVVRMDKRASTSPPPRVQLDSPRIPYSPPPRFDHRGGPDSGGEARDSAAVRWRNAPGQNRQPNLRRHPCRGAAPDRFRPANISDELG